MANQTALITGASSGIGEALATLLAKDQNHVVLVARNADKLEQLAQRLVNDYQITATVEVADLSRRGGPAKLATAMRKANIQVDILVNNAGVLEHGMFTEMPTADHKRMIDLNISGLTNLLNQFLPDMVKRGHGRVLNVASISAFQPVPSLATYAATKAYVLSLTESLAEELRGTGVTITALCPSVTATPMLRDAQSDSPVLNNIPRFLIGDVDDVAQQGYSACLRGDVICVPGTINLATTLAGRATPKWLLRRISGVLGRYTAKQR